MPAGGLFSTAERRRPVLPDGPQRRRLQGEAVSLRSSGEADDEQANRRRRPGQLRPGLVDGGDVFGHGGAYATNMTIDPKRGLITVLDGAARRLPRRRRQGRGAFKRAAEEIYGKCSLLGLSRANLGP